MANEITTTPDSKSEERAKENARAANGVPASGEAVGEALKPGRKITGEEALDRIFEKNAELYRRLA
jgi:hypothetical protein